LRGLGVEVRVVGRVFIMFWERRGRDREEGKGKCVNNRIGYDRYRKAGR
jgi:hypothetical protein